MDAKTYLLDSSLPNVVVQVSITKAGAKFLLSQLAAVERLNRTALSTTNNLSFKLPYLRSRGVVVTVLPVIQGWAEAIPPKTPGPLHGRVELEHQRVQFCWVEPKKPKLVSGSITDTFLTRLAR
jgi:hypothetical protein